MKRQIITPLLTTLLLLGICFYGTSCSNELADSQWTVVDINVSGDMWRDSKTTIEAYHYAIINLPELTEQVFHNGAVMVFFKLNKTTKSPLPYVKTFVGSTNNFYTETYSFNVRLGQDGQPSTITIILGASDAGLYKGVVPNVDFRVVLMR